MTGVSRLSVTLEPKRLEFLRQRAPNAAVVGLLVNPTNPRSELVVQQIEEAARVLGLKLLDSKPRPKAGWTRSSRA